MMRQLPHVSLRGGLFDASAIEHELLTYSVGSTIDCVQRRKCSAIMCWGAR